MLKGHFKGVRMRRVRMDVIVTLDERCRYIFLNLYLSSGVNFSSILTHLRPNPFKTALKVPLYKATLDFENFNTMNERSLVGRRQDRRPLSTLGCVSYLIKKYLYLFSCINFTSILTHLYLNTFKTALKDFHL